MGIPSTMLAAVASQPGPSARIAPAERPVPRPTAGQALVKVAYAGVNHIDLLVAQGQVPADPAAHGILGLEASGTVAALGAGVQGVRVGEHVAWMGGLDAACYAEYAVVDAARLASVPAGLALDQAACVPVAATTALHLIGLAGEGGRGKRALVHAATGGVGTVLVQLLRQRGFEVIALTRSAAKQVYLASLGAHGVLVTEAGAPPADALGGAVDVSFNALGGASVAQDIALLAPYGQVMLYGLMTGLPQDAGQALVAHWNKSAAVRAADIFTQYLHQPQAFQAALLEGLRLAAAGQLLTPRSQVVPLREAGAALARLAANGAQGKVVLRTG